MTKDKEKIRELYEQYIKDGGLYISRLFTNTCIKPESPAGLEQMDGDELFRICMQDEERKERIADKLNREFREENADIIRLYAAISSLMEKLSEKKKGFRLTEHQRYYPELIRETYGANVFRIADGIYLDDDGTWQHFEPDTLMHRKRKVALTDLLNYIEKNSDEKYVQYDFDSSEAIEVIEKLAKMIAEARKAHNLQRAIRIFRFIEEERPFKGMSDALFDLVAEAEGEDCFLDYEKSSEDMDFEILYGDEELILKGKKQDYASEYKLFLNGKIVSTAREPEFVIDYGDVPDEITVGIKAIRTEEDYEDLIEVEKKKRNGNNFLRIASDNNNRFNIAYERYILAKAALSAVERISPVTYDRQKEAINRAKRRRENDMWPLVCILGISQNDKRG